MRKKAFTLVEVLVSLLIIVVISTASYLSFVVLSTSVESTRNKSMAVNCVQKSIEEIRRASRNEFDHLENYSFEDISSEFPRFTRTLSVTGEGRSSELKRAEVTVSWNERGIPKEYTYTLLISRPPLSLPGNIKGKVTNVKDGSDVVGAEVKVTYDTEPTLNFTTHTNSQGNYTFADPDTNNFRLKTGKWKLTAKRSGYYDYTHPELIEIASNNEEDVDFSLEPKPDPAIIKGRVVDKNTYSPLYQYVTLYENGKGQAHDHMWWHWPREFKFTIQFDEPEQKCFTLITGYYGHSYYYPYIYNNHCGDFCDPHDWGKNLNYRGWSSSVVKDDGSVACNNPWFGSSAADRICVNPGDELNVGDIRLKSIPYATLKGSVYNEKGDPIENARIYVRWHDWNTWSPYPAGYTNKSGYYQLSAPAEQELFPDENNYYLIIGAGAYLEKVGCCNEKTGVTAWSWDGWERTGPSYQGSELNHNFTLKSPSDDKCGDARGYVKDGKTGNSLKDVWVGISGWKQTDSYGYYVFECSKDKKNYCSIPVGSYWVYTGWKRGYYDFQSYGNNQYANRGTISIQENTTAAYETIRLWPRGYGTITGRVVIAGTDPPVPIKDATVKLDQYGDGGIEETITTKSTGKFTFTKVIESWPPPDVVGDSYYNQTKRGHSLHAEGGGLYDFKTVGSIMLDAGQTQDVGDIGLVPKGGM